jgi:hypothetical protein
MLLLLNVGLAQNLVNTGTINNTGTIRVKNQAIGIPSNLNGTFELFGADQTLPAKNYHHVRLSGTGIKTTSGGNLSILKNLTIASSVTLNITKGTSITLGDTLFESGTLAGAIQKSVDLTGSTTSSNFGNIGAAISWSSPAPGITNVLRISDSVVTGNGNQSIKRIYTVTPTATDATGTVTLKYASAELNGNSAGQLELWKTLDNGATWLYQGGTVDTVSMQLTKTNAVLAGMWTASDSLHRLGSIAQANIPIAMSFASPNSVSDTIASQLNSFTLLVVDAFGNPVKNVPVSFSLGQVPGSAVGQLLSDTLVTTDSTGKASTQLTLGNKVGTYVVTASSGTLPPISFTASAVHGAPSIFAYVEGNNQLKQILETVDTSFTVTLHDVGGNPVNNAMVLFSITGRPANAAGDSLSADSVLTDSLGRASVFLTLGNKVGTYTVAAASVSLPPVIFTANAVNKSASSMMLAAGNNQIKSILAAVDTSFTVTLVDIGGNPVEGALVQFSISAKPVNASGDTLSAGTVFTDSLGRASSTLTLGNKVGMYTVTATSASLPPIVFSASAVHGPASVVAYVAGNNQMKQITQTMDTSFTVTVMDVGSNPVNNALVLFSISGRPAGAAGDSLSADSVLTDSLGRASTQLTLGNKVGTYTVSAASASLTPVLFTANALHGPASSLARTLGNAQSKPISTALDTAFVVTVNDAGGNPVANATVQFSISSIPSGAAGQSLSAASVPTDSLGQASTILTLGSKTGTYKVSATVSGSPAAPIEFNATALPGLPSILNIAAGSNQSAVNGQPLADPFVVSVVDGGGNPIAGASIQFGITSAPAGAAGQGLSDTLVATDNSGQASTLLTLGNKTGEYTVVAQSSSVGGTLIFKAKAIAGVPATMNALAGNNQSAPINTVLPVDLSVLVHDLNGNPVPNDSVTFALSSQPAGAVGAQLSRTKAMTDSNGSASTQITLGNKVGTYSVTAMVNGVPTVVFNNTAHPGTAMIMAAVAGNNQSAPIITSLGSEFVVNVKDAGGNNTPNVPVTFAILSVPENAAMYSLRDTIVQSDANGIARTSFRVGSKVGTYIVRASGTGIPNVDFSATALPGAPAALQAIAGISQTKQILTPLDIPFSVRITDIGGNNVPASAVRFAVTSAPAGAFGTAVSDSISLSDSTGTAQARLTLGSKIGTYEVTAFVPAAPAPESRSVKNPKGKFAVKAADVSSIEIKFTATATHGAAAVFAQSVGDRQVKPTETKLDTAFTVTIHDIGGNIVPDAQVRFAISSAPVNAAGQQLSDTLVTSDSTGSASTYLTLGDHEGAYTVSAAVPAVAPKLFVANAYFIYGDPNSDIDINVADITTIIDHAVAGKLLSYADSVKADLNHDGNVDTADVNVLRDVILNAPLLFAEPVIPDESAAPEKAVKTAAPLLKQTYFAGATTELAITPQGLRVNLNNSVPVRGIELRLRLKDTTAVDKINYLFSRAQGMTTAVKSSNRDITLLAYSLTNAEIASGNGSILRLPNITSLDQIDTSEVILSISSNIAVQSAVTTASASPSEYPTTFELDQNYPNPFNGSTIIQYSIPDVRTTETKIAIHIFNILGQKVKTLVTGPHDPGKFKITWDGTNDEGARVSSGVYFYRLIAKNFLTTKKMIYVK